VRLSSLLKRSAPNIGEFDANLAIRNVLDLTQTKIRKDGISLDISLGNIAPVMGDRGQFQQVVLNLVANAMEAMEEVYDRVRLLRIETREVEKGYVRVSVEDSGAGVDQTKLQKIYDAFFTTKQDA
jgi:signal transduction histidine kinase